MKKDLSAKILILILAAGICLIAYPSVSNYWNSFRSSRSIVHYAEDVSKLNKETYNRLISEAQAYNESILWREDRYVLSEAEQEEYDKLLSVDGSSILGYIEIPKINVRLPIYHGIESKVLQIAAGHIPGTSMPIGGENTHCVISGHRGLPGAKLFSDLDRLIIGDRFTLTVLDEVLKYEVDQILIVQPNEIYPLNFEKGQDLCTLTTCTPYGINTERLLVRGHRVENDAADTRITADALRIEPVLAAPLVAAPVLLALFAFIMLSGGNKKPKAPKNKAEQKPLKKKKSP